jgi:hypothetical protein
MGHVVRAIGGLALIGLGVLAGVYTALFIEFSHVWGDTADDPAWLWGTGDTFRVLFFGSLAFVPGVWLVVSEFPDEATESRLGHRVRAGITLIIVGATYAFAALRLVGMGRSDYDPPVPSSDYVFATLIGGIPLLLGVALLVYGPVRRALSPSSRQANGPPPAPSASA